VACGKNDARKSTAMGDDLKRDLQLASQAQRIQISPDEIAPKSHQDLAMKPKKAPEGPKVIRTEKPTIKASAMPVQAAEIAADVPQVQVVASSPTPTEGPSDAAPPLARPSAIPASAYPATGTGNGNGVGGGILSGVFGAVLRGGIVGGDDDCDPRHMPGRGRPIGSDATGVFGGGGGMGTMRRPY
jgi:hypothetical protein